MTQPTGQNMSELIGQALAQPMPYLNQMVTSFNANTPRANPSLNTMNQRPLNSSIHGQMNSGNQAPSIQLPDRPSQKFNPRDPPASRGPARRIPYLATDSVSGMNCSMTGNGYAPQSDQQISPFRRAAPYPDPQVTKFKHRGTRTSKKDN